MDTKQTSQQFKLNLEDLGIGALVSAVSALLTALLALLQSGSQITVNDLKSIGIVALTSGVAYLAKNFFTPSQTIVVEK